MCTKTSLKVGRLGRMGSEGAVGPVCQTLVILVMLARVLGLLNQYTLIKRPDRKFRQGFIGVHASQRGVKTSSRLPCSLPQKDGAAHSLHEGWGCVLGFPRGSAVRTHLQCRRLGFIP